MKAPQPMIQNTGGVTGMKFATRAVVAALALAGLVLTLGCSYQSVHHLKRQTWAPNSPRTLTMNYLTFTYTCGQRETSLSVQGRAFPRKDTIPGWAGWIDDIWLGAYLSDNNGRVLAKSLQILPPQTLNPEEGLAFEFSLKPHDMGSPGPVFVSFGYRLVLTAREPKKTMEVPGKNEDERVFFASESALTRF